METSQVKLGLFTYDLGDDWVAVDVDGEPYVRAKTREIVERAAPDAAAYLTGADWVKEAAEDNLPLEAMLRPPHTHEARTYFDAERHVTWSGYEKVGKPTMTWPLPKGWGCMMGESSAFPYAVGAYIPTPAERAKEAANG